MFAPLKMYLVLQGFELYTNDIDSFFSNCLFFFFFSQLYILGLFFFMHIFVVALVSLLCSIPLCKYKYLLCKYVTVQELIDPFSVNEHLGGFQS